MACTRIQRLVIVYIKHLASIIRDNIMKQTDIISYMLQPPDTSPRRIFSIKIQTLGFRASLARRNPLSMALPTARFHEHERLEFGHVERQPRVCLQSPNDVRSKAPHHIHTSAPFPNRARTASKGWMVTHMTVLSLSGSTLPPVRSVMHICSRGILHTCHSLYARSCCGRGGSGMQ